MNLPFEFRHLIQMTIAQHLEYRWLKWSNIRGNQQLISISKAHQLLWFRNPKVASSSISSTLRKADSHIAEYPMPIRIPTGTTKRYFSFAFVRNPYHRIHSLWKQKVIETPLNGAKIWGLSEGEIERLQNFDFFLDWVEQQDLHRGDAHYRLQTILVPEGVQFIGRMERLAEDWKKVLDQAGLPQGLAMEHRNKTKKKPMSLSQQQAEKIWSLYEADFVRFYPEIKPPTDEAGES